MFPSEQDQESNLGYYITRNFVKDTGLLLEQRSLGDSDGLSMGLESVILGSKPFGKYLHERWRRKSEDNIKLGPRKIGLRMRYGRTGSGSGPMANFSSW
jgi:hypothetical protein